MQAYANRAVKPFKNLFFILCRLSKINVTATNIRAIAPKENHIFIKPTDTHIPPFILVYFSTILTNYNFLKNKNNQFIKLNFNHWGFLHPRLIVSPTN